MLKSKPFPYSSFLWRLPSGTVGRPHYTWDCRPISINRFGQRTWLASMVGADFSFIYDQCPLEGPPLVLLLNLLMGKGNSHSHKLPVDQISKKMNTHLFVPRHNQVGTPCEVSRTPHPERSPRCTRRFCCWCYYTLVSRTAAPCRRHCNTDSPCGGSIHR